MCPATAGRHMTQCPTRLCQSNLCAPASLWSSWTLCESMRAIHKVCRLDLAAFCFTQSPQRSRRMCPRSGGAAHDAARDASGSIQSLCAGLFVRRPIFVRRPLCGLRGLYVNQSGLSTKSVVWIWPRLISHKAHEDHEGCASEAAGRHMTQVPVLLEILVITCLLEVACNRGPWALWPGTDGHGLA